MVFRSGQYARFAERDNVDVRRHKPSSSQTIVRTTTKPSVYTAPFGVVEAIGEISILTPPDTRHSHILLILSRYHSAFNTKTYFSDIDLINIEVEMAVSTALESRISYALESAWYGILREIFQYMHGDNLRLSLFVESQAR